MSTQEERIEIFNDTRNWYEYDQDLIDSIMKAKAATKVYMENEYPEYDSEEKYKTEIIVSKKRTFQAAMDLHHSDGAMKIAVLNFANAFHAGGGVEKGSSAQEESLCRCSTLYPLIHRWSLNQKFYGFHKILNDSRASDSLIFTPGVIICKTDTDLPKRMDKKDWVETTVITCAAPDLRTHGNQYFGLSTGSIHMSHTEQLGYHFRRAIHILTVAAAEGIDTLVLGAFGCGAFQNDPETVAKAYKMALNEFKGVFRKIEFAVYCTPGHEENYDVFQGVFGKNSQ